MCKSCIIQLVVCLCAGGIDAWSARGGLYNRPCVTSIRSVIITTRGLITMRLHRQSCGADSFPSFFALRYNPCAPLCILIYHCITGWSKLLPRVTREVHQKISQSQYNSSKHTNSELWIRDQLSRYAIADITKVGSYCI